MINQKKFYRKIYSPYKLTSKSVPNKRKKEFGNNTNMLQQAFRTIVRNKLATTTFENITQTNVKCFSNVPVTVSREAQNLQELALDENCILVDENDRSLGLSSKRDCHRVNADGESKLHRAFSVFLFNTKGEMLLQKRSSHKVNLILINKLSANHNYYSHI